MAWTERGAAENLAKRVGPGMWQETREKLQDLAQSSDPEARAIASSALGAQQEYDNQARGYDHN